MNKKQTLLAALIFFAGTNLLQAQSFFPQLGKYSAKEMERVDRNYAACLESGNEGIVESALALVSMMKLDVPGEDFEMIKVKINSVAVDGETPAIRYKAYLAGMVFSNPAMFREETMNHYSSADAFFAAVAKRLSQTLLSSN